MLNVLNLLDSMISKADIPIPKTQEETTQNDVLKTTNFKDILDDFAYKQRSEKDKELKDISKIFQDIFSFFQNITNNTLSKNTFLNDKNQDTNNVLVKLDNNTKSFAVGLLKDIEKLSKDINPNFDTNTIENIIKNIQNPKSNERFFISISIPKEIIKTSKNTSNLLDSILSSLDKHILSQKDISSHISSLSFSLILEKENISETLISLKAQKVNLNNLPSQIKPFKDIEISSYPDNIKTSEETSQKGDAEIPIQEDVSISDNTSKNKSDENIVDSLNNYQAKSTKKDVKKSDIPSNKILSNDTQANTDMQVENQQTKTKQLDNTKNISYKSENVEINIEINNTEGYQLLRDYTSISTKDEKATDIHTKDTKNKDANQPNQTTKEYERVEQDIENNKALSVKSVKNLNSESISNANTKSQPQQKQKSNNQVDTVTNMENNYTIAKKFPTSNNPTMLNKETTTNNNDYKNIEEQKFSILKEEIQSPKETNTTYYKANEQNIKDYIAKNINALNLDNEPLPKASLNNLHDFTNPVKDIIKDSPGFQAFSTNDKQKDNKDNNQGFSMNYQQNIQTNQQNTSNSINTDKIFKEVEKTVLKEAKNPVLMKNVSIQLDDGTSLQIKFNANNLSIAINTNTELVYKDSQIKDLLKNLQNLGFSVENITINGTTIESQMEFSQNKEQNKDDKEDYKKSNTEEKDFEFVNAI